MNRPTILSDILDISQQIRLCLNFETIRSRQNPRRAQHVSDLRPRFVPVGAMLVGVRDLKDARFVQRFA